MAFESLKRLFAIKKYDSYPTSSSKSIVTTPSISAPITSESTSTENLKAKMDLLLTQVESLNVRYETLNQRLQNLEKMIQEIYMIAKRA